MNYFAAALIAFVSVLFKALQNRNYNHNNYALLLPTSLAIAGCELYLPSLLMRDGIDLLYIVVVGTFSAAGGALAMMSHNKWFIKRSEKA